ncbi:MAG: PDZ domain-containing protein, partial [Pyrinomonadaceae bacterium]
AWARVLARRASVPQPWLGARGDAVTVLPLDRFISNGWPREQALSVINKRRGVMLTAVAPGTPADEAGLRPGDVIARVSEREVAGVDDFSFFLKEAGGGSTLNFTVFRALEDSPLKMSITLSGARNPAVATQGAEARAAEERARAAEADARAHETTLRKAEVELRELETKARREELEARAAGDQSRIAEAQKRVAESSEQLRTAQAQVADAMRRVDETVKDVKLAQERIAAAAAAGWPASDRPHLVEGLEAVRITPKLAARFRARGGLLVVAVRPGSRAERAGLAVGDVIETFNGEQVYGPEKSDGHRDENFTLTLGVVRDGRRMTLKAEGRDTKQSRPFPRQ